ncbi:hypothetical protein B0H19DRAFT_1071202 [Mycena capillaripes]|nr:hypothetical protein B0H19DRAFT_1071202 [Mycena capillaripes]
MPAVNEPHLRTIPVGKWEAMEDIQRVRLWATGVDLFILRMKAGPKTDHVRSEVTKNNRMDALIEGQVQGLRVLHDDDDDDGSADYTDSIRTSTLREVLEQGEKPGGLVLNALDLPGRHFVHPNPLLGTGFDLEYIAYCQTNGLPGFHEKYPPYGEMYFKLLALAHAFSLFHFDISGMWLYISGAGEKFWIRAHPRASDSSNIRIPSRDITDSTALKDWQPDKASVKDCDYEVVVLPAGAGVLLQQLGREHAVISSDTGDDAASDINRTATWTVGGYFFCASSIRPAMSIIFHMVMLQHILTNSDHFAMWPIFVRVNMFWLNITTTIPADDLSEAEAANAKYVLWRQWLAENYACFNNAQKPLDWESEIFSPCPLHLAITLSKYHQQQRARDPDVEVFQSFTEKAFPQKLCAVLAGYDLDLVSQFKSKTESTWVSEDTTKFFLFDGSELHFRPLKSSGSASCGAWLTVEAFGVSEQLEIQPNGYFSWKLIVKWTRIAPKIMGIDWVVVEILKNSGWKKGLGGIQVVFGWLPETQMELGAEAFEGANIQSAKLKDFDGHPDTVTSWLKVQTNRYFWRIVLIKRSKMASNIM